MDVKRNVRLYTDFWVALTFYEGWEDLEGDKCLWFLSMSTSYETIRTQNNEGNLKIWWLGVRIISNMVSVDKAHGQEI